MANTIRDYSATPANNTVVDGADISEGCSPAGINDAIRGVMSDLKDVSTGAVALESPAMDSLTVDTTGIVYSGGNVGIGTASPSALLHLDGTTPSIFIQPSADTEVAAIRFRNAADSNTQGMIEYNHSENSMSFRTNGVSDRVFIDSSGNVLVGTTSTISSNTNGGLYVSNNGYTSLFNREDSAGDGNIMLFAKGGSTVGSIGSRSAGNIYIDSAGESGRLQAAGSDVLGWYTGQFFPASDAGASLGTSGNRFSNLYLSGGVYLGGTGSANHLDDYEEGTWTPTVSGRTFASSKGHYTKVGNLVFIHFECEAISSAISNPLIGGLPFTASPPTGSPADYSSYISCDEVSSWTLSSGYTNIYFRVGAGVTTLQALQSTGENHSSGTSWGTNGNVRASGFYYTNS